MSFNVKIGPKILRVNHKRLTPEKKLCILANFIQQYLEIQKIGFVIEKLLEFNISLVFRARMCLNGSPKG